MTSPEVRIEAVCILGGVGTALEITVNKGEKKSVHQPIFKTKGGVG